MLFDVNILYSPILEYGTGGKITIFVFFKGMLIRFQILLTSNVYREFAVFLSGSISNVAAIPEFIDK